MIYLCQSCGFRVEPEDTETVTGQHRLHSAFVLGSAFVKAGKPDEKPRYCGGTVDPIEPSKGDTPERFAELVARRTERYLKLLNLNAPELILNEERRMIREAADSLITFNPKTDDTKATLQ